MSPSVTTKESGIECMSRLGGSPNGLPLANASVLNRRPVDSAAFPSICERTELFERVRQFTIEGADWTKLHQTGISLVQWNTSRESDCSRGALMHRLAELKFNFDQAFGTLAIRHLRAGMIERRQRLLRVPVHVPTIRGDALFKEKADRHAAVLNASFAALSGSKARHAEATPACPA